MKNRSVDLAARTEVLERPSAWLPFFERCKIEGLEVTVPNVTKRIWYALLRRLGLEQRRPYQTRHTAATLWLAAGENPECIARQLGHASTEMLLRRYSRFVPNLTRQDGSAFEALVAEKWNDRER